MKLGTAASIASLSIALGAVDCRAAAAGPDGDAGGDWIDATPAALGGGAGLRVPSGDAAADFVLRDVPGFPDGRLRHREGRDRDPLPKLRFGNPSSVQAAGGAWPQSFGIDYLGRPDTGSGATSPTATRISGGEALARLLAAGNGQAAVWLRQLRGNVGLGLMQFAYRAASWVSPGSRRPLDLRLARSFMVDGYRAELSLAAETLDAGSADPRPGFPFQRRLFVSLRADF